MQTLQQNNRFGALIREGIKKLNCITERNTKMKLKKLVREKLNRVAESGNPEDNQLVSTDQCKYLVGLIDALEEIQTLHSARDDESSQIAFIALKGKR